MKAILKYYAHNTSGQFVFEVFVRKVELACNYPDYLQMLEGIQCFLV